jgi:hypothetical protein
MTFRTHVGFCLRMQVNKLHIWLAIRRFLHKINNTPESNAYSIQNYTQIHRKEMLFTYAIMKGTQ